MTLSRMELDGTSSPLGLVTRILAAEPALTIPIPVEDIARALDIAEIEEIDTEGFLGGLVTDPERSSGGILVKRGIGRQRRRFTIGHELGHFLIPYHEPASGGKFMCDRAALHAWETRRVDRYLKMEAEANRFSAALLMPPPHVRRFLAGYPSATLAAALALHEEFDVSKEAAIRCYVENDGDRLAAVIAHNGTIQRWYRHRDFPWLDVRRGDPIPDGSRFHSHRGDALSPLLPTAAEDWIATEYGERVPFMREQILPLSNEFTVILLWMEEDDGDFDKEEAMTSKERYASRMARYDRF